MVPTAVVLPDRLRDDILGYALPPPPEDDAATSKGKSGSRRSRHRKDIRNRHARELGTSNDNVNENSSSENERCHHHHSDCDGISGDGTSSSESEVDSEEESEAMARCRPLAEGGDPQAMLHLAIMYEEGRVAARNTARARRWLQKAARGVNAEASYRLGKYHEEGLGGLQPSVEQAKKLYTDAALEGDRMAAMALQRLNGWLNDDGNDDDDKKSTEEEEDSSEDERTAASATSRETSSSGGGLPGNRGAARSRRPIGGSS